MQPVNYVRMRRCKKPNANKPEPNNIEVIGSGTGGGPLAGVAVNVAEYVFETLPNVAKLFSTV